MADLKNRIEAFAKTGMFIKEHFKKGPRPNEELHSGLEKVIELSHLYNGWFTPTFVKESLMNIGEVLKKEDIESLCAGQETSAPKTVALICAGNIPMVGFHDIMCVLLSGHTALIKLSSDDNVLLPFFLKLLVHFEPELEKQIRFADGKMSEFDAVIATGSNNTASHFEYYFAKFPRIIRKNRTSVAILDGTESEEELKELGKDIFLYFGLGCRNVSKLLVPRNYDPKKFFESIHSYGYVIDNKKYAGNYDYHRAIYLLENEKFLDNNFLLLKNSDRLHSPVATLYLQEFSDKKAIQDYIDSHAQELQCIVGKGYTPFGYSQKPVISDFADNVNTWEFLLSL